jgi:hypothetical protein
MVDNIPLCIMPDYIDMSVDAKKITKGEESFHPKNHIKKCKGCSLNNICFGVPEDYLKTHGEIGINPL